MENPGDSPALMAAAAAAASVPQASPTAGHRLSVLTCCNQPIRTQQTLPTANSNAGKGLEAGDKGTRQVCVFFFSLSQLRKYHGGRTADKMAEEGSGGGVKVENDGESGG